jgi:hypothetical protein
MQPQGWVNSSTSVSHERVIRRWLKFAFSLILQGFARQN